MKKCQSLLARHHYLGSIRPVGERLYYAVINAAGEWLGVFVFNAAAKHLRAREKHIGWNHEQRRRRLALVVNNSRFLLLPERTFPNLASKALSLVLARLPRDWQDRYGHPVALVETFVDPEQFCGTLYTASGWLELGRTDGYGRKRQEYYVKHHRPKKLFIRELARGACRGLQAEALKPGWAMVEAKSPPRPHQRSGQLRSLGEHFRKVVDPRARFESYPLWSLLTITACAFLCGAQRGSKALAAFAQRLTQPQRRALGIRRQRDGTYPAPSQPTFWRMLASADLGQVEQALLRFQQQLRGPPDPEELVVLDGKKPRHGGGGAVLTAVTSPGEHYLGSAEVSSQTNEIPVAQELIKQLDLEGRLVSLDALHTQTGTAQDLVQECGADYLLTVKGNQPELHAKLLKLLTASLADVPPSGLGARPHSANPGNQ